MIQFSLHSSPFSVLDASLSSLLVFSRQVEIPYWQSWRALGGHLIQTAHSKEKLKPRVEEQLCIQRMKTGRNNPYSNLGCHEKKSFFRLQLGWGKQEMPACLWLNPLTTIPHARWFFWHETKLLTLQGKWGMLELTLIKCFLCNRHCARCFTCMISLNLHNNPITRDFCPTFFSEL